MRALLEAKYGADAGVLIDRLEAISKLAGKRGAKLALDATELLLAYHSGKPTQSHEVGGPGGGPFKPIALMSEEELRAEALALAERLMGHKLVAADQSP
jgi:hypothetical protein